LWAGRSGRKIARGGYPTISIGRSFYLRGFSKGLTVKKSISPLVNERRNFFTKFCKMRIVTSHFHHDEPNDFQNVDYDLRHASQLYAPEAGIAVNETIAEFVFDIIQGDFLAIG